MMDSSILSMKWSIILHNGGIKKTGTGHMPIESYQYLIIFFLVNKGKINLLEA